MDLVRIASASLLALLAACGPEPAAEAPLAEGAGEKTQGAAAVVTVAAASDLAVAFGELADLFRDRHGMEARVVLGSTGLLARQIAQGAPFDVFFAANQSFVDELIAAGHGTAETRALYARGRIVTWVPTGSAPRELGALRGERFARIAIANPEHAPYGLAARQALEASGLWTDLLPRIVYGENVNQTLQLVTSGNVEVGIVALSLALARRDGDWALIDGDLHEPIDQALVMTSAAQNPAGARAFVNLVSSPEGRAIMRRYGFVLPGETFDIEELRGSGTR